jgi:hypothetical protein
MKLISVIEDKPLLPKLAERCQFNLGAAGLKVRDSSGDGMIKPSDNRCVFRRRERPSRKRF